MKTLNLIIFIFGLGSLALGCYLIYPPLAFISVGLILMVITLFDGRRSKR
jgi:hypothetical protein